MHPDAGDSIVLLDRVEAIAGKPRFHKDESPCGSGLARDTGDSVTLFTRPCGPRKSAARELLSVTKVGYLNNLSWTHGELVQKRDVLC